MCFDLQCKWSHLLKPCSGYPGQTIDPDRSIRSVEDEFVKSNVLTKFQHASLQPSFPKRAGYGTLGTPIVLWTNHFSFDVTKMPKIFRYEFKFDPEANGPRSARLIQKWLFTSNFRALGVHVATDWRKSLITSKLLPPDRLNLRQIILTQDDEDEPDPNTVTQSRRYKVGLLSHPASYSVQQLLKSLQAPGEGESTSKPEIIAALNIITGYKAKELSLGTRPSMMTTGANKHFDIDIQPIQTLGGGLVAFRGYYISVRATATRFLLNTQIKHAVAYRSGPLTALADEIGLSPDKLAHLGRMLRMCKVSLIHLPRETNNQGHDILRIKTIRGLAKQKTTQKVRCNKSGDGPSRVSFLYEDKQAGIREWRTIKAHFQRSELRHSLLFHMTNEIQSIKGLSPINTQL